MILCINKIGGGYSFRSQTERRQGTVLILSPKDFREGGLRRKGGDSPWL